MTKTTALLTSEEGSNEIVALPRHYMCNQSFGWMEYKEPVVEKYVRYLRSSDNQPVYMASEKEPTDYAIRECGVKRLGSVEVTITDGKLTDVRILE